jgi:hypothetical protein
MGNNDGVIDQMVLRLGKLHVATDRDFVQDIGIDGESNFVMPNVQVPRESPMNVLDLKSSHLASTLNDLHSEARAIQERYLADAARVLVRSDSAWRTFTFLVSKTFGRLSGSRK